MRDAAMRHPWIVAATLGWMSAVAAATPALGARRVGPYLAVVTVVGAIVAGRTRRHDLPSWVLGGISLLGLLHCAGGLLGSPDPASPILYDTWLVEGVVKYDQAVHLYGSGIATAAAWYVSDRWTGRRRVVRAAAIGVAVGLVNEVVEFGFDLRFPTHVGAWDNAAWDLVFNLAGVVLALLAVDVIERRADPATGSRPARTLAPWTS